MSNYSKYYPCIIFLTRYQGVYEGNTWACIAFSDYVPPDAIDDDVTCCEWWSSPQADLVGRGSSPDKAYENMVDRHTNNPDASRKAKRITYDTSEYVSSKIRHNIGDLMNMITCDRCKPAVTSSSSKTYYS